MEQNIEIEFKNHLEKEEFHKIVKVFGLQEGQFADQVNHYFDTPEFVLKDLGAALRIREKGGQHVLTLKQPYRDGLLETHQPISAKEAEDAVGGGKLPRGGVAVEIEKMGVPFSKLSYFGTLATSRAEIKYESGLLVLDHSRYLGAEDFELEFEAEEYQEGKRLFLSLLERLGIPLRETPNKIRRFYDRKLELQKSNR